MTWERGRAEIEHLLASGDLDQIHGAAAQGAALLASAEGLVASAHRELNANPEAAFALAYDAARKSCAALLAQQGLRTRSAGHHVTTERVVRLQFGGAFEDFAALRRRRAEIQYPRHPGDMVTTSEAAEALARADAILSASGQLLGRLTIFRVDHR